MSAYNSTLKDGDGNYLYPKTLEENVYDSSSNRLDQKISTIQSNITQLNSDLASDRISVIYRTLDNVSLVAGFNAMNFDTSTVPANATIIYHHILSSYDHVTFIWKVGGYFNVENSRGAAVTIPSVTQIIFYKVL